MCGPQVCRPSSLRRQVGRSGEPKHSRSTWVTKSDISSKTEIILQSHSSQNTMVCHKNTRTSGKSPEIKPNTNGQIMFDTDTKKTQERQSFQNSYAKRPLCSLLHDGPASMLHGILLFLLLLGLNSLCRACIFSYL